MDRNTAKLGCAANLVLHNRPLWLRRFWLCDKSSEGFQLLQEIKAASPATSGRTVEVLKGDFNRRVDDILESGKITDSMATFCLLDQWTFECHWATVEKLARHKQNGLKIELFYFLGSGWLDRAMKSTTTGVPRIERWWGRDDWRVLLDMKPSQRADAFGKRFAEDLGYGHVQTWPIYKNRTGRGALLYHMIHCSDHERAPLLMHDAYRRVARPAESKQSELYVGADFGVAPSKPATRR